MIIKLGAQFKNPCLMIMNSVTDFSWQETKKGVGDSTHQSLYEDL